MNNKGGNYERLQIIKEINESLGGVRGNIQIRYRRCKNKGCTCRGLESQKHGPSYYLSYKEKGMGHKGVGYKKAGRMVYIPANRLEEVRRAIKVYEKFKELVIRLEKLNLQDLKLKKQQKREEPLTVTTA